MFLVESYRQETDMETRVAKADGLYRAIESELRLFVYGIGL